MRATPKRLLCDCPMCRGQDWDIRPHSYATGEPGEPASLRPGHFDAVCNRCGFYATFVGHDPDKARQARQPQDPTPPVCDACGTADLVELVGLDWVCSLCHATKTMQEAVEGKPWRAQP